MAKKFFTDESLSTLITESKKYADSAANAVKNDLLNGAGEAYDTLKELGDLIDDNQDAISALETVATNKADKDHTHSFNDLTDKPTADDALALLAEIGMIDPVVDSNGAVYVEDDNVIYTL